MGLACGLLAGLINGLLIAYTKIPPFIATLGMMVSARGVADWYTKGQPVSFPTEAYAGIGAGFRPVREVRETWNVPLRLGMKIPAHLVA